MSLDRYEHRRFITVALNDAGFADIDHGLMESGNIATYELPPAEFYRLYDSGYIWEIDGRYGLMLDDYESGTVDSDFAFLAQVTEPIRETCPTVARAVDQACRLRTMVSFGF